MSILWIDGFDHYGTDTDFLTNGSYAEKQGGVALEAPTVGARTGDYALKLTATSAGSGSLLRKVLDSTENEIYVHFGLYLDSLPEVSSNDVQVVAFRSAANALLYYLTVTPTGALTLNNSTDTAIISSSANTVVAGTWTHVAVRLSINSSTGVAEIKVNDASVASATSLNTGSTDIGIVALFIDQNVGLSTQPFSIYIDDLVISDNDGTYNTGYLGEVRVRAIYPNSDDEQGWTAVRVQKYGAGVCLIGTDGDGDGFTCADSSSFEFGTGDFTMEGFFKFSGVPSASELYTLFAKYRTATDERSYRLYLGGSSVNGEKLEWAVSTDGTTGTLTTLIQVDFVPVLGQWYHIAIQRGSSETVLFINGIPQNAPVADANNYHDNTSLFCVGGTQNTSSALADDQSFVGYVDEIRVTKGVSRYSTNGFTTPSAAFPRSVGAGDASYASVSLLAGFDSGFIDEGPTGRAITVRGNTARVAVDDASPGDYKTIDEAVPNDDNYMQASYTAASGYLTFGAIPLNNETVTFDGTTYTFETAFSNTAGKVLIGVSVSASIDNLAAAINGDAGAGTVYGTGTTSSSNGTAENIGNQQMYAYANTAGVAGNSIATTETLSDGAWTSATLTGGADIPSPSSFTIQRLPAQTTGVRAVQFVTRARKTDSGPCQIQTSLVTADASTANGADRTVSTTFTFYSDIIEEDPSTSSALTPSTFVGAKVRIDRTA